MFSNYKTSQSSPHFTVQNAGHAKMGRIDSFCHSYY